MSTMYDATPPAPWQLDQDRGELHGLDRLEAYGSAEYAQHHRATYPPITRRPVQPHQPIIAIQPAPELPSDRVAARRHRSLFNLLTVSFLFAVTVGLAVLFMVGMVRS
ncbi:hypothetical protein D6T64_11790 [Cryobacterium melibiosiphilum]|uniref:Uncharacterized protein n=1 Tax=Cryobacterium melibiosiphilum TaxID=995039 RepID=A0A3A5MRQ3_9MICO|nr:hypothetical protein [Cryobacterium melibiosiphilum]RJT88064.1 hypothetical protein D6T64_11790 [Cryobacterium melibiosiphilum]